MCAKKHFRYPSVEEKERIVLAILDGNLTVKQISELEGYSREALYSWVRKYKEEGLRRKSCLRKPKLDEVSGELAEVIVSLKTKDPTLSHGAIQRYLRRHYLANVSRKCIYRVLKNNGLLGSQESGEDSIPSDKGTRRFEKTYPNEMWQMDILHLSLPNLGKYYLITVIDDYSRYILISGIFKHQLQENVISVFLQAVRTYGIPESVLTDQGKQFYSPYGSIYPVVGWIEG